MLKKLIRTLRKPRKAAAPKGQQLTFEQHGLRTDLFSRNAVNVALRLQEAGFQAFLVGGCVRDALLGERPKDFDVATSATPEQVREVFRNSRIIGRRFRLVHVLFGREMIEVATFRSNHTARDAASGKAVMDSSGRILRDNVYGTLEEDALRRDFTINALYYDPANRILHDFAGGMSDLEARTLRLIGDPETRYQEDPVRMLRAIRFAAKLGFDLPPETATPIHRLAPMLGDIPAARLYEEVLKVFLNGSAEDSFDLLQQYNLFAPLFPLSAAELEQDPEYCTSLVRLALRNTDVRLAEGKTVTPAFLFAALLWPGLLPLIARCQAEGLAPVPAIQKAAHMLLPVQIQRIAIPRRFTMPMQEIWALQERLPYRYGKRAETVLAHPRFRAAYDFLLLREDAGEDTGNLGQWWTDYQFASEPDRRRMITELSGPVRKSRRPRKRKARTTGPAGSNH
ncbi:polynucleotide adenylyltransferase PcnB [Thiopseudomonas denitrificans]|uniref:Poly(A) polymerase I n=1 Tax=Thiopseudomonas denitrificans TaxID=1501432 RepID=A0A4V3D5A5_9GAMM|nr:polynucleotide adenylyltransferase PcnB [Thiopseudomonas denitrificans]TDQ39357.1 poly(A) polymerase [Thiopseudomonas denitrificans]